ncbi:MAG: nitronate monooxygenase [Pseudomonadales bacterium]
MEGGILTNLTGRPARAIVNRVIREIGPIRSAMSAFPSAANAISNLRAEAEAQASVDFSPYWAGQNVYGCKELSAGDLTRELANRYC